MTERTLRRSKDGQRAQLSGWIRSDVKEMLVARAHAEGRKQIQVLEAALEEYLRPAHAADDAEVPTGSIAGANGAAIAR